MPRALSLKKASKSPAKSQKTIIHFFKNCGSIENQELSKFSQASCSKQLSGKRKATSPSDDHDIDRKINRKSPKKIKTDYVNEHFASENTVCITGAPSNVLSNCKLGASPRKNDGLQISTDSEGKGDKNLSHSPSKDNEIKTERSPLSTMENIKDIACKEVYMEFNNKSSLNINENNVRNHEVKLTTPIKLSLHRDNGTPSPLRKSRTPKKSPMQEFLCTPIKILRTPEKQLQKDVSPSKCGSTMKVLDFDQQLCDEFGDDFDVGDFGVDNIEDLDLSVMQRCEITAIIQHASKLELSLKNSNNNRATCYVEGIWLDTPLTPGDVVSVLASRSSGQYSVNNSSGLLVLRPDHLVSSTSVVAGVFCQRKALLQERWRGIDSANTAMTTGILIHELVQKALTQKITTLEQLRGTADTILKESTHMLYDAGLSEEESRANIQVYIPPLAEFMNTYIAEKPPTVLRVQKHKDNWSGHIDKVLDIEENLCCPQLGLKGKIDATLQVTIHNTKGRQRAVVPLELKSGKASASAEHRGQLVLYNMMLNLQRGEHPAHAPQTGLLLYLRDRVDVREVSCGYPERRDLVMLRNQLVRHLAAGPREQDPEQLTDIEDASVLLQQTLPDPVDHHNACSKCPYLTLCSIHLWHTNGPTVTESHPLTALRDSALGHLTEAHIKYFLHWTALLRMEERGQMVKSPLHALWTDSVEKREKRGTCASNLILKSVESSGDRYLHVFLRTNTDAEYKTSHQMKGPQEGEFSIVSVGNRPWIAAGVVTVSNTKLIHILLERDLSRRLTKDTLYHIDTYESYATTVQNLTNLGVLMEDSERAHRLRKLIIDKEHPQFDKKLPRDVGRLGTKLLRSLNIQQQRAVLKALSAQDYALLQGLPGTGKTQTISVLIQMLVGLKQRVLVTAHTHSAVDTVLGRLPRRLHVLRLGPAARVAPPVLARCEQTLTAACDTPDKLAQLYDSMEVVGVTCLGATHAMLAKTTFDVCIVDEATQVLQSTVLRPLFAARRFVLVGDPDQLPPVIRSRAARRMGMEESLFHRLSHENATSTLQLQYRMNRPLADLANTVAYNSTLKCADQNVADARLDVNMQKIDHLTKEHSWLKTACSPESEHVVLFLDTGSISGMIQGGNEKKTSANTVEACLVIAIIEAMLQGDVKSSDIGVIAPYRDQVALLKRALAHRAVEVSTVDQFQGRDKPVIIYSCTKWDERHDEAVKEGEVLNDQRRLAVGVTRAKHKFLVIGNSNALRRYTPLQRLIEACSSIKLEQNTVISMYSKYKSLVT